VPVLAVRSKRNEEKSVIAINLALMLAFGNYSVTGCSDTDETDVCVSTCDNYANGGTGCQTNNFLDPDNPPWTFNWQCACVSQGEPAHCEEWKIVGCGTWCYMIWAAAGCFNPAPCSCFELRIWSQPCYSVADCSNKPGHPTCANPFQDCDKRVATVFFPIEVTGYVICCP
jgi:hypothetical protein